MVKHQLVSCHTNVPIITLIYHVCVWLCATDFGAAGECVELIESKEYVGDPAFGTSTTQLHKVHVMLR